MAPDGDHPGPKAGPPPNPDVTTTVRHAALTGDFINARPKDSALVLHLESASLTGRISSAVATAALGKEPTRETYREIGHVTNAYGAVAGGKGVEVTLDAGSRWTVTGASYLTSLTLAPGAQLDSASGHPRVTVNGKPVKASTGNWHGAIVVTPE
jgi:hypothetical protein